MRFKIDENPPSEIANDLGLRGYKATTVHDERLNGTTDAELVNAALLEDRIILTLDKGIASLLKYPGDTHAGIVLFRPSSVGRKTVLEFVRSRIADVLRLGPQHRLMVVTEERIRLREVQLPSHKMKRHRVVGDITE